jgi:hypothetical protein
MGLRWHMHNLHVVLITSASTNPCAQALMRKYVPLAVVIVVVLLVLWLRKKFY